MGKNILTLGLGKAINTDPEAVKMFGAHEDIAQLVQDLVAEAKAAGFDCTTIQIDLQDWEGSLKSIKEKLESQYWDGFTIGFGFRGLKHHTAKFEDVVNLSREVSPSTKLGFPTGPEDIWKTIQRMFPSDQE